MSMNKGYQPNDLHPSIVQAIELDFASHAERQGNRRNVLEYLAKTPNAALLKDIALALGISVKQARSALQYMRRITGIYQEEFGFTIIEEAAPEHAYSRSAVPYKYSLELNQGSYTERERGITQMPRGELMLENTDRDYRMVSQAANCRVTKDVPEHWESLVHNSCLIELEGVELRMIQELIRLRLNGLSVLTEHLKNQLDIPPSLERYKGNLSVLTEIRAIELGFILYSFKRKYLGIFFLDPDERYDALIIKKNPDNEDSPYFDHILPFDPKLAKSRYQNMPLKNKLSKGERKAMRMVIQAQSNFELLTSAQLCEITGLNLNQLARLRQKLKDDRFVNKIYFRTRGGSRGNCHQECILLDSSYC